MWALGTFIFIDNPTWSFNRFLLQLLLSFCFSLLLSFFHLLLYNLHLLYLQTLVVLIL
jgi:hypothetical protein